MRLAGKVALVTGAQQGIGKAIALAYGREGASVVLNYLDNQAAAEESAAQSRALGQRAVTVAGDVSQGLDVRRMIEAGVALGGLDIVVNNAGIFPRVEFLDMTEAQWDEVLNVNLKGTFLCTQAAAQQMVQRGQGGAVLNLASGAAFRSSPRGVHYVSSKAGIVGLTRAAALELAPYRVRVNAIAPGITDTAQPRYGMSEAELQAAGRQVPLGRMGTPEDVADLALFLASDEPRHITGHTLPVNGGQSLYQLRVLCLRRTHNMEATRSIRLTVNGTVYERTVAVRMTLADFLRDELNLTGTHLGCEHGVCGACTILYNGAAARSCLMLAVQADGAELMTVECLAPGATLHPLQQAFTEHHALQSGFCPPGFLMTAYAFLQETPHPSADEVREAIAGNICRCTGYAPIVQAIVSASRA